MNINLLSFQIQAREPQIKTLNRRLNLMSSSENTDLKRKSGEMSISPRKASKKLKALSDKEATDILESVEFKAMLEDKKHIFSNIQEFAKDLLATTRLADTDPTAIIKTMLTEGWVDKAGMICNNEGEKSLLWKQIRTYNSALSTNLANNTIPDLTISEVGPVAATELDDLVRQTNDALKLNNENLQAIVDSNKKILVRVSENEQKSIRKDLEDEHLKIIGHDLDLKECSKKTGWEIAQFARTVLNKNWHESNKILADKAVTTAKDITDNIFIQGHNLMSRITVTALGKDVKPNKNGVSTVSLLFTFSTQIDRDLFNNMAQSFGVSARPSLPKGYKDQQTTIMDMYPTFAGTTKEATWTKVDVRQARQDEQMTFTVQTKPADDRTSKWKTAGKVVIITPSNWGRLSRDDKGAFILNSFRGF